jgi:hypothetical protein
MSLDEDDYHMLRDGLEGIVISLDAITRTLNALLKEWRESRKASHAELVPENEAHRGID